MLMEMALWPLVARLLLLFFGAGVGAVLCVVAECGNRAGIGIGAADGLSIRSSLVLQQHFQRQMTVAKRQMATPIMAAGEVKAQCESCALSWSS